MDNELTTALERWINTPPQDRDYTEGAIFVLKLTSNQILYQNVMRNLDANKEVVDYNIRKFLDFRREILKDIDVEALEVEADKIGESHTSKAVKKDDKHLGRRDDHEALPQNIQQLYVDNLTLLHKIRELHLQLRKMEHEPAALRLPLVKDLIAADKLMHKNWEVYDTYYQENGTDKERPKNPKTAK